MILRCKHRAVPPNLLLCGFAALRQYRDEAASTPSRTGLSPLLPPLWRIWNVGLLTMLPLAFDQVLLGGTRRRPHLE